mmetsp:Transcript_42537/g.102513  ORF Transcript_42537/g.102513 Transcript_42537/m.102513 type:complete len:101 (+) Transcript_42537:950-1252(+)
MIHDHLSHQKQNQNQTTKIENLKLTGEKRRFFDDYGDLDHPLPTARPSTSSAASRSSSSTDRERLGGTDPATSSGGRQEMFVDETALPFPVSWNLLSVLY